MTLCVAWIRQAENTEELIFATDSTLTGGEKWNSGVKLFELPRKDCLLCFAGSTFRAYPLILNLISSIKFDQRLQSPHTDISEVLDYLTELFSDLSKTIIAEVQGQNIHELRAEARFLFGGWSWIESRFRVWELYYSEDAEGFVYKEHSDNSIKALIVAFLGDPDQITEIAIQRLKGELLENDIGAKLDMEPLRVLAGISRDNEIREVDGSLQIAKIYKSGTSEFFGIMWPSIAGSPHFLGREFNYHNKPKVRYYDPDTFKVIEDQLPEILSNIATFSNSPDFEFIQMCYPDGELKIDLSENDREKMINIFKDHSYKEFIANLLKELNPE